MANRTQSIGDDVKGSAHPNPRTSMCIIEVRENSTGIVREYIMPEPFTIWPGDENPSDYIWSEGNYACDCNRALFFNLAAGIHENDHYECSDGLYSVRVRNRETGVVFYSEF